MLHEEHVCWVFYLRVIRLWGALVAFRARALAINHCTRKGHGTRPLRMLLLMLLLLLLTSVAVPRLLSRIHTDICMNIYIYSPFPM